MSYYKYQLNIIINSGFGILSLTVAATSGTITIKLRRNYLANDCLRFVDYADQFPDLVAYIDAVLLSWCGRKPMAYWDYKIPMNLYGTFLTHRGAFESSFKEHLKPYLLATSSNRIDIKLFSNWNEFFHKDNQLFYFQSEYVRHYLWPSFFRMVIHLFRDIKLRFEQFFY